MEEIIEKLEAIERKLRICYHLLDRCEVLDIYYDVRELRDLLKLQNPK